MFSIQTPWQKSRQELTEAAKDMKGAIEGLPAGFFDDKKRDDRVCLSRRNNYWRCFPVNGHHTHCINKESI